MRSTTPLRAESLQARLCAEAELTAADVAVYDTAHAEPYDHEAWARACERRDAARVAFHDAVEDEERAKDGHGGYVARGYMPHGV